MISQIKIQRQIHSGIHASGQKHKPVSGYLRQLFRFPYHLLSEHPVRLFKRVKMIFCCIQAAFYYLYMFCFQINPQLLCFHQSVNILKWRPVSAHSGFGRHHMKYFTVCFLACAFFYMEIRICYHISAVRPCIIVQGVTMGFIHNNIYLTAGFVCQRITSGHPFSDLCESQPGPQVFIHLFQSIVSGGTPVRPGTRTDDKILTRSKAVYMVCL